MALIMILRGAHSRPMPSAAFAVMGLLGFLIGSIQMQGHVPGAFAFLLGSCLTALLGMVLVGAPVEDRAVLEGRAAPPVFSRAAWYAFPLLAWAFLVPMVFVLVR